MTPPIESPPPFEGAPGDGAPLTSVHSSKHLLGPPVDELGGIPTVREEFDLARLSPQEASFRHSGWRHRRVLVWEALKRLHVGSVSLVRFACCGSAAWVQHSESRGRFRVVANLCRCRWCVPCGVAKAARLVRDLLPQVEGLDIRFITLTLRHSDTPLRDQIDRLYRSYTELKSRPLFRDAVDGAAAFFEVKVGRDGLWHPHLHILAAGRFIDQKDLSREWHKITGDSSIVDIRRPPERRQVLTYVTKYVTKPLDGSVFSDPCRLDEAICALKGRRLCNGSGCLRKLSGDGQEPGVDDWCTVGRFDALCADASAGDPVAVEVLRALRGPDRHEKPRHSVATHPPSPP